MSTLRADTISKNFAGLQALADVSLELSKGEILGLIGPNGSGKTTLLNVVSGFMRPDGGHIYLNDVDITGWETNRIARSGIGRTFQTAKLFAALTVKENLEAAIMTIASSGVDQNVERLLAQLGLTSWAESVAGALPYGVQRRLEIARALGIRPAFLLLDEPAAGLNEEESEDLLGMIEHIRTDEEFGCGILVIDHDPGLILRLCDSIHVLNEGRTIAQGTPDEIRHDRAVIESYLGKDE